MSVSVAAAEPERFGRFRVLSVLATGGMGVVHRAVDERDGAGVALKTLSPRRAPSEFDLGGLRREILALQRLDHPGVVRIVAAGVRDGVPWYAMPLLEGQTLAAFGRALRSGADSSLPDAAFGRLGDVLTLARRLAATLAFLHGEGIVHRDLTPANVFVEAGEHPRLLDFGLFRRFAGDEGRESLDDYSHGGGTAGYMAPEQARGELADARADLYALGVILYELVTGRAPGAPSVAPSTWVRGLPHAIDAMIVRLLAVDPADRFGHASELVPILAAHGARAADWEARFAPRDYLYRPRLIGRQSALAAIDDRVGDALERRGGVVLIAGESGVGKTYLAMHAARLAASYGVEVLSSSCGAKDSEPSAALQPFRAILHAVADRCVADPSLAPTLLGAHGRVLAGIEPRLAELPLVASSPRLPPVSAEVAQRRLFAALDELLGAYGSQWPCLLVLDDLQWADELSLRFLASLPADWFAGKGLLVLATHRSDEEQPAIRSLEQRPFTSRLSLSGLDEAGVRALVCDMLALREAPRAWTTALSRASGGNPFFVAEYLRAASGTGALRRDEHGRWRFEGTLVEQGALPAPPRIDAILSRRFEGLSDAARALLSALVVLDKGANPDVVSRVAGLDEPQALEGRRELLARQLVEAREGVLEPMHDALRDHAHRRMDDEQRRAYHLRAAHVLEARAQGSADFELIYASLARHFALGGSPRRAVDYFELAAERALANGAHRDALAHLREALALGADVPSLRRGRFLRRAGEAAYALGELAASEDYLSRALGELGEATPRSIAWNLGLARDLPLQVVHRLSSPGRAAPEAAERARLDEAARTYDLLAERAYFALDAPMLVAASLRAVNCSERAGEPLARPYAKLGLVLGLGKLHGLARRYFELARAATAHDPLALPMVYVAEAAFHTGEGDWRASRPLVEVVLDAASKSRDLRSLGLAETLLGHEQFYRGQFRESAETFARVERRGRNDDNQQYVAWGLYAGARARIPLGELDLARRMLREADVLLEDTADAPSKLIVAGLTARVHLALGAYEASRAAVERCEILIRTTPPTVFSTLCGYVAVAELRLRDARHRDRALLESARRAVADLRRFAFAIPLGRPAAARLEAELLVLERRSDRARMKLQKAIDSARALGMSHEESLALVALERLLRA